jgi:hypothetical protein
LLEQINRKIRVKTVGPSLLEQISRKIRVKWVGLELVKSGRVSVTSLDKLLKSTYIVSYTYTNKPVRDRTGLFV